MKMNLQNVLVLYTNIKDKYIQLQQKKEVILPAGVFDTPKLLQLSGVGPKQWLETLGIQLVAENSQVGRKFIDQMAIYMAF